MWFPYAGHHLSWARWQMLGDLFQYVLFTACESTSSCVWRMLCSINCYLTSLKLDCPLIYEVALTMHTFTCSIMHPHQHSSTLATGITQRPDSLHFRRTFPRVSICGPDWSQLVVKVRSPTRWQPVEENVRPIKNDEIVLRHPRQMIVLMVFLWRLPDKGLISSWSRSFWSTNDAGHIVNDPAESMIILLAISLRSNQISRNAVRHSIQLGL